MTAACKLTESQAQTWEKLIDHVYEIVFKTINDDGDAI